MKKFYLNLPSITKKEKKYVNDVIKMDGSPQKVNIQKYLKKKSQIS